MKFFLRWGRSLQALLVTLWPMIIVFGAPTSVCFIFGVFLFGNPWMRLLMIGYLVFCYIDRRTCQRGGRSFGRRWFRNNFLWRYYANYFPVKLVKTAEIDPTKNAIYCSYPHGIYVTGAMTAFNSGASDCTKLFPGIDFRMATLDENFWCPFFREFMYIQGCVSCDARSLDYLLSTKPDPNSGPTEDPVYSRGCVLIVGGGAEAAMTRPGNHAIVLKTRKGFVRIALKHGASLVPVYSFGENDIYDGVANAKGSRLRNIQEFLKKYLQIPILPVSQGFKPHRKPIIVVVGSAIEIPKIENPTQEDIDKHHARFIEGIVALFEAHKSKYVENHENVSLILE